MERDLDRIRLQAEHFTDLPGRQVRPIPETDQLPLAVGKRTESSAHCQPSRRIFLELSRCRGLNGLRDRLASGGEGIVDAPSRDPEHPGDRLSLRGVV